MMSQGRKVDMVLKLYPRELRAHLVYLYFMLPTMVKLGNPQTVTCTSKYLSGAGTHLLPPGGQLM